MEVCHFLRRKQTTKGGPVMLFAQFFAISDIRIPHISVYQKRKSPLLGQNIVPPYESGLSICKAKIDDILAIPSTISNQYDLQLLKKEIPCSFFRPLNKEFILGTFFPLRPP